MKSVGKKIALKSERTDLYERRSCVTRLKNDYFNRKSDKHLKNLKTVSVSYLGKDHAAKVTKKLVIVSPSASLVLENIGIVYPSMSMIVIGHSLLY